MAHSQTTYANNADPITPTGYNYSDHIWNRWMDGLQSTGSIENSDVTVTLTTVGGSYSDEWWQGTDSAQTAVIVDGIWTTWVTENYDVISESADNYTVNADAIWRTWAYESVEQKRAREAQARLDNVWEKKEQGEAEEAAQELLGELIGKEQLAVYLKTGRVIVKGDKQDYLLRKGHIPTILTKGKVQDLCIHLKDNYTMPKTDQVIADILGFKYAEKDMLMIGNKHRIVPDQNGEALKEAAVG